MTFELSELKGRYLAPFLFLLLLISCAGTRPLIEQSRAHSAMSFAKENGALKHSPKNFRKGLSLLQKADVLFEERRYKDAKEKYYYSMKYFEKAETRARLSNAKNGGF